MQHDMDMRTGIGVFLGEEKYKKLDTVNMGTTIFDNFSPPSFASGLRFPLGSVQVKSLLWRISQSVPG